MSLMSVGSQKVRMVEDCPIRSVWENVVWDWIMGVGSSPDLASHLSAQQTLFEKIGIQLEWFEQSLSPEFQLIGMHFKLPFQQSLVFFQERELGADGSYGWSWQEALPDCYFKYQP